MWDQYFSELFEDTDIVIDEDETVILVEPEFFDWLLPLMIATPDNIMGKESYQIKSFIACSCSFPEIQWYLLAWY